ncbi:MAG TPA: hypothetical protein VF676_13345 [Flavobacterium sp.]|jgi:hypothetical protein
MKVKIYAILAFIAFGAQSCKNDGKETKADAATEPAVQKFFSVEMDVAAEKDDNFAVYYTEDNTINFNGDNAVWSGVKGGNTQQNVVFNLSEDVIPTHIRLDFGINKEQGDVLLRNLKVSYYGKSFEAKGSEFFKYFIPNDSVKTEIDQAGGTIKFLKNPKKHFTPFYYPQQAVLDEIGKLTK